jgi:hypothetical protein
VIEFGVKHGGSMQMWREYFGPGAQIVGIDIDPRVDVLIDDGGHTMDQQLVTFQELYFHLQPRGVYICEDVHTSYIPAFGDGLRRPGTFIEFAKGLVDWLHAWYCAQPGQELDPFPRSTHGMHFYDSMVVLEKRRWSGRATR